MNGCQKAKSNLEEARQKGKESFYAFVEWNEGRIKKLYVLPTESVIAIFEGKKGKDKLADTMFKKRAITSVV